MTSGMMSNRDDMFDQFIIDGKFQLFVVGTDQRLAQIADINEFIIN